MLSKILRDLSLLFIEVPEGPDIYRRDQKWADCPRGAKQKSVRLLWSRLHCLDRSKIFCPSGTLNTLIVLQKLFPSQRNHCFSNACKGNHIEWELQENMEEAQEEQNLQTKVVVVNV